VPADAVKNLQILPFLQGTDWAQLSNSVDGPL